MNKFFIGCIINLLITLNVAANEVQSLKNPIEPIYTGLGSVSQSIEAYLYAYDFENRLLQEQDKFNGYTFGAGFTIPFLNRYQLRVDVPFYTKGTARHRGRPNKPRLDIKGNSNTFDFPTISIEGQFAGYRPEDLHALGFVGVGAVGTKQALDTTHQDKINHRGRYAVFGLRADKRALSQLQVLSEIKYRYYFTSDDINPTYSDAFGLLDIAAGIKFQRFEKVIAPIIEVIASTNFAGYSTFYVAPEVGFRILNHTQFVVSTPIGLTSQSDDYIVRGNLKFTF